MKWPPTKEALDWVKVKNSPWKILSANSWLTLGWLLANCLPTVFIMCSAKVLANCWPTVNLAAKMWKSYVKAMKSNWTYTNHCVNTNLSRISCSMTNNFIISKLIVFIIFSILTDCLVLLCSVFWWCILWKTLQDVEKGGSSLIIFVRIYSCWSVHAGWLISSG